MLSQITINQERKNIHINTKKLSTYINVNNKNYHEYGLNQIIFDPTKNSPPNNFMVKLKERMTVYN